MEKSALQEKWYGFNTHTVECYCMCSYSLGINPLPGLRRSFPQYKWEFWHDSEAVRYGTPCDNTIWVIMEEGGSVRLKYNIKKSTIGAYFESIFNLPQ